MAESTAARAEPWVLAASILGFSMVFHRRNGRAAGGFLPEEVLHCGYDPHHLLELGALVDTRRLVPGKDDEDALVGVANASQVTSGIGRKLFRR
jgi:ribosomal protein L13E